MFLVILQLKFEKKVKIVCFHSFGFIIHVLFFCLVVPHEWLVIISKYISTDVARFCRSFSDEIDWRKIDATYQNYDEKIWNVLHECKELNNKKPKFIQALLEARQKYIVEELLESDKKVKI